MAKARRKRTGQNKIDQKNFVDEGGSKKTSPVLSVGDRIGTDMEAAALDVGESSILRIRISTAPTFIAFDNDAGFTALEAATLDISYTASPVIELIAAGVYEIACPKRWARASTNPDRIELVRD